MLRSETREVVSIRQIGIPRALYYFHYHTLWRRFFEELGFEVVVSPPTNKQILDGGLTTCVDGACLAIKSYVGHSLALVAQDVDYLFVPQITSVARQEYTCPYFLGLPDVLRQYVPPSTQLLSPVLDARKRETALGESFVRLGLSFARPTTVRRAWNQALEQQRVEEESAHQVCAEKHRLQILILGPRYLIDDPFLSGNLCERLRSMGAQVYTASQVPEERSWYLNRSLAKRLFWSSARRSMGAVEYFLDRLDGVISLSPFGCGAESLVGVLIARRARERSVPMMALNIDEHSSEVGMVTRLEAFCDLIERKKSG